MKEITINDCSKRRLEDIYSLVGIDKKGFRTLINVSFDRKNNNRYCLDCFENLKARGNKNIKRAAKVSFSSITYIDSITDIMPKFYKFSYEKMLELSVVNFMIYMYKKL